MKIVRQLWPNGSTFTREQQADLAIWLREFLANDNGDENDKNSGLILTPLNNPLPEPGKEKLLKQQKDNTPYRPIKLNIDDFKTHLPSRLRNNTEFMRVWHEYLLMRVEKLNAPMTWNSYVRKAQPVLAMCADAGTAIGVVERAIRNCWQGLFLKTSDKTKPAPGTLQQAVMPLETTSDVPAPLLAKFCATWETLTHRQADITDTQTFCAFIKQLMYFHSTLPGDARAAVPRQGGALYFVRTFDSFLNEYCAWVEHRLARWVGLSPQSFSTNGKLFHDFVCDCERRYQTSFQPEWYRQRRQQTLTQQK